MHDAETLDTPRTRANHCFETAQRLDAIRETIPRRAWRAQVETEWPSWLAALEWALGKQGNILLGQRLVGALETAWWVLPEAEAQRWIRAAFEATDEMTPRNVRARLNLALARLRIEHHRFKSCLSAAQRALAQAREVGDVVAIARAQFLTGHSLVVLGQLTEGERLLEAALSGFRKAGAPRSAGRTLASLALAREQAADIPKACSLCRQAVETLAAIEGDDGDLDHVSYLAELEFRAGNSEEALRLIRDALARHRKRDERLHILVDLSNESAYLLALDRYDEACSEAREALARAVREKDPLWTAFALLHLAAAGALLGDRRHAARLMGFVDGRMAELQHQRGYTEEHERERVMPLLRRAFKDGELASLMAEGAALSEDAATAEALEIAAVGRRPASEEQR